MVLPGVTILISGLRCPADHGTGQHETRKTCTTYSNCRFFAFNVVFVKENSSSLYVVPYSFHLKKLIILLSHYLFDCAIIINNMSEGWLSG
jgi:hypothetical protein